MATTVAAPVREVVTFELRHQLEAELEAAGIATDSFGTFSALSPEPELAETLARSLTGEPAARGEGARRLLSLFVTPPILPEWDAARWAIGNALASLATPDLGDALIGVVVDTRFGRARQVLCEALRKTKHPMAPETLISLIDDGDVGGHAILELRMRGPKASLPYLRAARPRLEAVLTRPSSTVLARTQARRALARITPVP